MNETVHLEDLDAEVNWVDWKEKTVNVNRYVLLGCECCSESVNEDYSFSELSEFDMAEVEKLLK